MKKQLYQNNSIDSSVILINEGSVLSMILCPGLLNGHQVQNIKNIIHICGLDGDFKRAKIWMLARS